MLDTTTTVYKYVTARRTALRRSFAGIQPIEGSDFTPIVKLLPNILLINKPKQHNHTSTIDTDDTLRGATHIFIEISGVNYQYTSSGTNGFLIPVKYVKSIPDDANQRTIILHIMNTIVTHYDEISFVCAVPKTTEGIFECEEHVGMKHSNIPYDVQKYFLRTYRPHILTDDTLQFERDYCLYSEVIGELYSMAYY